MKKKYFLWAVLAAFLNIYYVQAQCTGITAPYVEDFDTAAGSTPSCWTESGGESWDYDNTPPSFGHIGDNGTLTGSTSSGGYFAWIDDSGNDSPSTLTSPDVDISSITDPALYFYHVSDNEGFSNATLDVEVFDGTTWNNVGTYSSNTNGWQQNIIGLTSFSGVIAVRFTITDSGSFYDDIAIDDIEIKQGPSCFPPSLLTASNETSSTVDLDWLTGDTETEWDLVYGAPGFDPNTSGTTVNDNDGTSDEVLTGLSSATDYEVYVKAVCGPNDKSSFIGPVAFSTACAVFSLPFQEDFSSSSTPNCWEESGDNAWDYSTSAAYAATSAGDHTPGGGTNYAWIDGSSNTDGEESTLTSPLVDVSTLTEPAVEFYVFSDNEDSPAINQLEIEVFDGANWNTLTTINSLIGQDWGRYIFSLSSFTITGDVRVRFTVIGDDSLGGNTFHNDILIDDVSFVEMPPCIDVDNVEVDNETLTSVDISWLDFNGSGVQWNIEYGPIGFTQGSGTTEVATTNPYTLSGLSSSTEYEFYVQSDCGGGDIASVEGPYSFETLTTGATCEVALDINSLPYSHTDDTANYQDNYEGLVGTNCGSDEGYLNGFETVYKYTPANDVKVDIKMSGLNGFYSGVFVYDSCADVGVTCLTGKAAGPSDDDYVISDYDLTAGEDYYFVVSSWLNPTVGYTFEIIPFDCAALSTPTGPANQDFVAGETLVDLEADVTKPTATLQWYSDAAATNPIPDTTTLVDATTYYVTQDFDGCESAPLAITVSEIDCTTLDITSSTPASVSCQGSMTLTATASGTGTDVYWYDAATGGNLLAVGNSFTTPALTQTTSYWATEVLAENAGFFSGQGIQTWSYGFGSTLFTSDKGLEFTATQPFLLMDVEVFSSSPNVGEMIVKLIDGSGSELAATSVISVPTGSTASPTSVVIPLSFAVPAAGDYQIVAEEISGDIRLMYEYDSSGGNFPQSLGNSAQITSSISGTFSSTTSYYYFYNFTIYEGEKICESSREEVVATVAQTGDEDVDYTDLPYSQSATTATYGNNFSGDAGGSCPGSSILDGNDVVYKYTADPTNDDILNFEASGLTNSDSGIYLYTSCGEVGTNCLEGAENDGSGNAFINDYYVNAGEEIFIVISSASSTTNYTLDIYGLDCNNVDLVNGDSPQDFVAGDFVSDLSIDASQFNSDITWYSDAALTMVINDPTTEALVDGETYYVTQTILGCESAALAITAEEVNCSALGVASVQNATICAPGGDVELSVQSSGNGNDVFWYDSASGGNLIFTGSNIETNVSVTTSYWVSEVFADGVTFAGQGKTTPDGTTNYNFANHGLVFNATQSFTLTSVDVYPGGAGGSLDVGLFDSSGNQLDSRTVSVPSGNGTTPVTINLNFNITPGNDYRIAPTNTIGGMVRDLSDSNFVAGNTYSLGNAGEIIGGVTSLTASPANNYYFFYNWTISNGSAICESPRQEVKVTVNDQPTSVPTGNATQSFCEDARVSDLTATGVDVQWYATDTSTQPLDLGAVLVNGETYYATQTIDACESETRLAVTVDVLPNAPVPSGDANQAYVSGETVVDLVVQGDNLIWYEDSFGLNQITDPSSTLLEDQESYYVSQTPAGQCESELLEITVHSLLSVNDDPIFDGLSYYPNPMKNNLHVMHTQVIDEFVIYNMLGQQVMRNKANTSKFDIQVSDLASGTYFMQLKIDGKSGIFKLIKE